MLNLCAVETPYDLKTWQTHIRDGTVRPFSFQLGDRPASFTMLTNKDSIEDDWQKTVVEYKEAQQPLKVTLTCLFAPHFDMVRLFVTLKAEENLTANVQKVQYLNLFSAGAPEIIDPVKAQWKDLNVPEGVKAQAEANAAAAPVLYGVTGGFAANQMPPNASKPWARKIDGTVYNSDVTFHLDSGHVDSGHLGKSSQFQMPLWVFAETGRGLWFGLEWSGDWDMSVNRNIKGSHLTVGMPTLDFSMYKGETIELPTAAFGPYSGAAETGFNHVRRMIYQYYLPTLNGRKPEPVVYWQGYGAHPAYHTEEVLYREVDRAAEIGCEAFCLDGGWSVKPGESWFLLAGNWENQSRFPKKGVAEFGKYVHSKGMRFGIWMEPRAGISTDLHQKHKGLFHPGDVGLMDLSQPEARQMLKGVFEKFINEYGADLIWEDYNVDPGFDKLDKPNRKGLLELGFYQGWYEAVDYIMKKYPNVWFESCASGGRIMDLGQLRRSHSIWVNDHWVDDDVNRNLRGGLNQLLPAVYIQNSLFLNGEILSKPQENVDLGGSHRFLTYFGGDLGFGQGVCFWKENDIKEAAKYAALYKQYRHYLEKDYYHLFPMPQSKDAWDGWQYHDPENDTGIVLVFRLKDSKMDETVLSLRSLKEPSKYLWSVVAGKADIDPANDGLSVHMAAPDAVLLQYKVAE
jgi:alpha-galactosidase